MPASCCRCNASSQQITLDTVWALTGNAANMGLAYRSRQLLVCRPCRVQLWGRLRLPPHQWPERHQRLVCIPPSPRLGWSMQSRPRTLQGNTESGSKCSAHCKPSVPLEASTPGFHARADCSMLPIRRRAFKSCDCCLGLLQSTRKCHQSPTRPN